MDFGPKDQAAIKLAEELGQHMRNNAIVQLSRDILLRLLGSGPDDTIAKRAFAIAKAWWAEGESFVRKET